MNTARAPSTKASRSRAHGLPLIGGGDWNDGMNRVGAGGQGESVWLGWLVYATLVAFAPIAEARSGHSRGPRVGGVMQPSCRASLEREAWDGDLVPARLVRRRHPVRFGIEAHECRIDSIAQAVVGVFRRGGTRPHGARHGGGQARAHPAGGPGWRSCSRRRSTRPVSIPAIIKGYPPGPARKWRPIYARRPVVP